MHEFCSVSFKYLKEMFKRPICDNYINLFFSVVVGLLHHCYIRYSNAKCDPLSSLVLFLGLVPPTLFSIHYVKMRITKKKSLCALVCSSPCVLLLCSFAHTVYLCVSVCLHHLWAWEVCVMTASLHGA